MLLDYYNLSEQPFGATPDPRYLYLSPTHREALASLAYGIQCGRGFMSLIATPGMGKTTILFHLLQHLDGRAKVAFLCQTLCRPEDIMRAVARDLGITDDLASAAEVERRLNEALLTEARQDRKVIIVIDEAQNLADESLEMVRLLSNFETSSDKLIQIVLSGQLQLDERLSSPHLLQLRQRMSTFARLEPLNPGETREYIRHRLKVAGYCGSAPLFTPAAENLIAKYSRGIPRNINNICFNALGLGWVQKQRTIQEDVIHEVVNDLGLQSFSSLRRVPVSIRSYFRSRRLNGEVVAPLLFRKRWLASALIVTPLLGLFGLRSIPPRLPGKSPAHAISAIKTDRKNITQLNGDVPATHRSNAENPLQAQSGSAATAPHFRSKRQVQATVEVTDPAVLWKKIGRENKAAEVELARMYLAGTVVPRNCVQAQVLLEAAAKRGSVTAAELLDASATQCK